MSPLSGGAQRARWGLLHQMKEILCLGRLNRALLGSYSLCKSSNREAWRFIDSEGDESCLHFVFLVFVVSLGLSVLTHFIYIACLSSGSYSRGP